MAIDADGPAAGPGRRSGSQLDPDSGQNDTSFHFCDTDQALPSEAVPFIVLPGGTFRTNTGLELGDVALEQVTGAEVVPLGGREEDLQGAHTGAREFTVTVRWARR